MLTVEADGAPAGLAYLRIKSDPTEAGVWSLWVEPAARRRGAAGALVEAAAGWAAERGAVRLVAWVAAGNLPARAFFAAAGFTPTGASRRFRGGSAIEEFRRTL
jgi:GNAT superfamily N-acetyltransferase